MLSLTDEVCLGSWWINNSGQNLLAGVEDDASNPIRLNDLLIVDFLRRIPAARQAFNDLVPNMLPEEQERLRMIAAASVYVVLDYKQVEDNFQSVLNKTGVKTCGRYGGTRRGGNC